MSNSVRSLVVDPPAWGRILDRLGMREAQIRDERYELVVHLRTAALGAEAFYQTISHETRRETAEQARRFDELFLRAWTGHPNVVIIDNSTGWGLKKERTIEAVLTGAGLIDMRSSSVYKRCRFTVSIGAEGLPDDVHFCNLEVEQHTQVSEHGSLQLVKRGTPGNYIYTLTRVCSRGTDVKRNLSQSEYELLRGQGGAFETVRKRRCCFVWNNCYFHLDMWDDTDGMVLEGCIPRDAVPVRAVPDFLVITTETPRHG